MKAITTTRTFRPFSIAGRVGIMITGLLVFAALALPALAQIQAPGGVGGGFDLSWNTLDGGGGTFSTGGAYSLGGTAGQPDAGYMSGGAYSVAGGFWGSMAPPPAVQLIGHVTWQGRPDQPHSLQQLPITLTLKSGASVVDYPVQTTDANGFFTVNVQGLSGVYSWRVKGPKDLANSGGVNFSGQITTQAEMGVMRAGDANNDNVVNVDDFNILKGTFGKSSADPGYDDRAEFTGDGVVEVLDFSLLKLNFGVAGADPLVPAS